MLSGRVDKSLLMETLRLSRLALLLKELPGVLMPENRWLARSRAKDKVFTLLPLVIGDSRVSAVCRTSISKGSGRCAFFSINVSDVSSSHIVLTSSLDFSLDLAMFKAGIPGGLVLTGSILAHSDGFIKSSIGAGTLVFGTGSLNLMIFDDWKDSSSFSGVITRGTTFVSASFNLAGSAGDVS